MSCTIQESVQTRMGEPKTAVEAAVEAFRLVCSSWPYVIVLRPQTRGKFASDPGRPTTENTNGLQ